MKLNKMNWLLLIAFIFTFMMIPTLVQADEAVIKCSITEKGEGVITVKVLESGILKKDTSQTFYLHPKTKIIVAGSETPLLMDSLVIGDVIQVTLGKVEKTKDGKMIQYVDKIIVFSTRRIRK